MLVDRGVIPVFDPSPVTDTRDLETLREHAIHEAAHYVVAVVLGTAFPDTFNIAIRSVDLTLEGEAAGRVVLQHTRDAGSELPRHAYARVLLAGIAAQAHLEFLKHFPHNRMKRIRGEAFKAVEDVAKALAELDGASDMDQIRTLLKIEAWPTAFFEPALDLVQMKWVRLLLDDGRHDSGNDAQVWLAA